MPIIGIECLIFAVTRSQRPLASHKIPYKLASFTLLTTHTNYLINKYLDFERSNFTAGLKVTELTVHVKVTLSALKFNLNKWSFSVTGG